MRRVVGGGVASAAHAHRQGLCRACEICRMHVPEKMRSPRRHACLAARRLFLRRPSCMRSRR